MVKRAPGKGRGVFAREDIKKGTEIERVPVLVLEVKALYDNEYDSRILSYVFDWGKDTVALALGYGSLYNHSFKPNARYDDEGRMTKIYSAVRNIKAGEEITINYNGEPGILDDPGFEVLD
ncbi:MAG: SET domain-containing protein-lysine N-methyltransferase [Gammaproteobacteria bacterium]|nr:SET domain-containing protein-lysine N-methyltransferase [Gammaproteobacteria bacterium]